MKTSPTKQINRAAFTLVEIMVIITIIAILAGIFTVVIGNSINFAREKQTRATIQKVSTIIKERMNSFQINKTKIIDPKVNELLTNTDAGSADLNMLHVYATKAMHWKYFGVDHLQSPPASEVSTFQQKKAYSSELLYELLSKGTINGVNPVPQMSTNSTYLELSSGETGDTDGDGKIEILDGWGEPIRFYLWPTRVVKPGGDDHHLDPADTSNPHPLDDQRASLRLLMPSIADSSADILSRDPNDKVKLLSSTSVAFDFASSAGIYPVIAEPSSAEPYGLNTLDTYHSFLLVSAGPDKTLGLFEPAIGSGDEPVWSLGMPLNENLPGVSDYNENGASEVIISDTDGSGGAFPPDASDIEHPYNSVMNDDITNHQGSGDN